MIKIASWNIRHGLGMDNVVDIRRVGKTLKELNADIYTIQEIDNGSARSGYEDQAAILSEILECAYHFTPISNVPEGKYGIATFSSLKMRDQTDLFLCKNKENNTAQLSRFYVKQSVFDVVNLHAPWKHNVTYWKNFIDNFNLDHCILSGDFNLSSSSKLIHQFKEKYNWKNESSTFIDGNVYDYTFVPYKVLSQEVIYTNQSDHYILVTTFDLW